VPLAELAAGEGLCCDTESFGLGFPSSLPPNASCLVPLPLNLPELEVSGLALVTAIDDCPPIAGGEGS